VVEYNGGVSESEIRNLLKESLSSYSYHEKTPEKALEFAKYITGLNDNNIYMDENNNLIIKYPNLREKNRNG
jgi:hypothetical protein